MDYLALLPLALLSAQVPQPTTADTNLATSMGCEVALAYATQIMARSRNHPLVFSDDDAGVDGLIGLHWIADFNSGRRGKQPSAQLLKAWAGRQSHSAVTACPQLRRLLAQRHILFGKAAVDFATNNVVGGISQMTFKAEIVSISLPLVDRTTTRALFEASSYGGPLAGGVSAHYFAKDRYGTWREVAMAIVAIS